MAHFDTNWTPVQSAPLNSLRLSRLFAGFGFAAAILFGIFFLAFHALVILYLVIASTAVWVGGVAYAHLLRRRIAGNRWLS